MKSDKAKVRFEWALFLFIANIFLVLTYTYHEDHLYGIPFYNHSGLMTHTHHLLPLIPERKCLCVVPICRANNPLKLCARDIAAKFHAIYPTKVAPCAGVILTARLVIGTFFTLKLMRVQQTHSVLLIYKGKNWFFFFFIESSFSVAKKIIKGDKWQRAHLVIRGITVVRVHAGQHKVAHACWAVCVCVNWCLWWCYTARRPTPAGGGFALAVQSVLEAGGVVTLG